MTQNSNQTEFQMTFSAIENSNREISPSSISIPKLIEALREMDRGARAYAPPEIAEDREIPIIALTGIHFGSLNLQFFVPDDYVLFTAAFTNDLEQQNWNQMPFKAYEAASNLYKTTSQMKANLRIFSLNNDALEVVIRAEDRAPERKVGFTSGSVSLPGQIIQAGGAKPAIDFRLDSTGKTLHRIAVDTVTARLVGSLLYTPVVIQGEATWNSDTWEIEKFIFGGLVDSPYQIPSSALGELHEILGDTWSSIDVETFITELRGGRT